MTKLCREQAREELILLAGGGAAAGVLTISPLFTASMTLAEIAVVNRIARIYGVDLAAAGGASAAAGALMIGGGAELLSRISLEVAVRIPFISQVVKPVLGASTVWLTGEAAIAYFESRYPDKVYSSNHGETTDA